MNTVDVVWDRLSTVTQLRFESKSNKGTAGWNGAGEGKVITVLEDHELIFKERGLWSTEEGSTLSFKNVFRWKYKSAGALIGLEHLRFGENNPVFLFDLGGATSSTLASISPHVCVDDVYTGRLELQPVGFDLHWYIKGPRKDEHIYYQYR